MSYGKGFRHNWKTGLPDPREAFGPTALRILLAIAAANSRGQSPTFRGLGKMFGMQKNAIFGHVSKLIRLGLVSRAPGVKARTLCLTCQIDVTESRPVASNPKGSNGQL